MFRCAFGFGLVLGLWLPACARETVEPASPPPSRTEFAQKAPSSSRSIRYLALGDSFTIGTGSGPNEGFPARLAARLRERGRHVELENLGVNGFTTDDLIEVELPRVRGFAPTLVTLAIGANDIVHGHSIDVYRERLRTIFGELATSGVAASTIVCLPQPDWAESPAARAFGRPADIEHTIDAFNAALREEAERAGARYADLGELMRSEAKANMIASDGLHPSARAHDAWAEELARLVDRER